MSASKETHDTIFNLSNQIQKTPVTVNEAPGFISYLIYRDRLKR